MDTSEETDPSQEQMPIEGEPEKLVTVATCMYPVEAHAKKLHLESYQIPVYLADELTITMDWLLSNAIGGVKVQVPEQDESRAREVLEKYDEALRIKRAQEAAAEAAAEATAHSEVRPPAEG